MLPLALIAVGGVVGLSSRLKKDASHPAFIFEGELVPQKTYRAIVARHPEASRNQIEEELRSLGFEILLSTTDPTEPQALSFLLRWVRAESGVKPPTLSRFVQFQETDEPPPVEAPHELFGPGLLRKEEDALILALTKDRDSKHLSGFATTLFPDFPVAGALLNAKAILAGRRARAVQKEKLGSVYQKMEHKLKAALHGQDAGLSPALLTVFPKIELPNLFPNQSFFADVELPESFTPRTEFWKAQEALKSLKKDDKAERVAALAILAPEKDSASQKLESLGFSRLFMLLPGNSLSEKAAHLAHLRKSGVPLNEHDLQWKLLEQLSAELSTEDLRGASKIIQKMLKDPQELCFFPGLLARKHKVSENVARAALATVEEMSEGVVIVDPARWSSLDPAGRLPKEPIPSSAFQLAFATFRPEESHVASPTQVLSSVEKVKEANMTSLLERAKNAIQRQKWVDWYHRLAQNHGLETPKLTGR